MMDFLERISVIFSGITVSRMLIDFFLFYSEPTIPYIKHHEIVKSIFPADHENILWLHASHTFPLFCELLALPEYTERLLVGLIASIGQLSESLVSPPINSARISPIPPIFLLPR